MALSRGMGQDHTDRLSLAPVCLKRRWQKLGMELVDGMDAGLTSFAPMIERLCYAALALIHITPASMLFRPQAIGKLYRVEASGSLLTLLHHRAALFVIVVIACLWGMIDPATRRLAVVVIATSMLSFLAVYWQNGSPPVMKSIALADMAGLPFLAFAAWTAFAK